MAWALSGGRTGQVIRIDICERISCRERQLRVEAYTQPRALSARRDMNPVARNNIPVEKTRSRKENPARGPTAAHPAACASEMACAPPEGSVVGCWLSVLVLAIQEPALAAAHGLRACLSARIAPVGDSCGVDGTREAAARRPEAVVARRPPSPLSAARQVSPAVVVSQNQPRAHTHNTARQARSRASSATSCRHGAYRQTGAAWH